jgi:hypothetical protein
VPGVGSQSEVAVQKQLLPSEGKSGDKSCVQDQAGSHNPLSFPQGDLLLKVICSGG